MYRFRHRKISLLLLPSAVRLATYSRVRSTQLIRPSASTCSARLASRLPPRFRRWRAVLPEEAGTGATPHRRAKDASLLSLSGDRSHRQLGRGPQVFGVSAQTKARHGGNQLGRGKAAQLRLEFFWRGDEQRATGS